ncbi:MAG: translocation/assembly module TamB domain-containing protein [Synechococcales bacterium]|nr:translocation/assembly module TamB domain-containing protein [Synechococcales bacterium]
MTQSPNPEPNPNPPENERPSRSARIWRRIALTVGGVGLIGGVAAIFAVRYFLDERLIPIAEDALSDLINRPVEIGDITRVSLTGATVDGATIPPTDTQPDYATVETVQVGFNPVEVAIDFIRNREIPIDITLENPELSLVEDEPGQWLDTQIDAGDGEEGGLQVIVEVVRVDDATIIANPYPQPEDVTGEQVAAEPVVFQDIDAIAATREEYRYISFEATGEPRAGGTFALQGEVDTETLRVNAMVQSNNLPAAELASLLPLPVQVGSGLISTNVDVQYRQDEPITLDGTAQVRDILATTEFTPEPIVDLDSRLRFQGQEVALEDTTLRYGRIPVEVGGSVDLEEGFDLNAQIPLVSLRDLQTTLNIEAGVPVGGAFQATVDVTGPLDQPVATGSFSNVQTVQVDQVEFDTVAADFRLTPPVFDLTRLQIIPTVGGEITGTGQANLEADGGLVATLNATLPGDAIAQTYNVSLPQDITIGQVNADIEVFGPFDNIQAVAQFQLPGGTYPGQGEIRYGDQIIRVQDTQFQVEGGTLNASAIARLDQQTWQATLDAEGVQIADLVPPGTVQRAAGILSADLQLAGRLDEFDLATIQAAGTAQLTETDIQLVEEASLIDPGTYAADFRWTGSGVQIAQFTGPGIQATGFVGVDVAGAPEIGQFDLDVALDDYRLARLEPFLPAQVNEQVDVAGTASFLGAVTGTLENPAVLGNLRLDNFAVNQFGFDAPLAGEVQFSLAEGGALDLVSTGAGVDERIAVRLNDEYFPTAFLIRNTLLEDEVTVVQGQTENDILVAEVANLPLSAFEYRPAPEANLGIVRGVVNANLAVNVADLSNPNGVAQVAIANPGVGTIIAESFTGQVRYADQVVDLSEGVLLLENSRYLLAAELGLTPDLPFDAQVVIDEAQIQDILTTLQWYTYEDINRGLAAPDYAGAEALDVLSVGRPGADLLTQLAYSSKFIGLLVELELQEAEGFAVPELGSLQGNYTGQISASGSLAEGLPGIAAEFDVQGENWEWGRFDAPNEFVVAGAFAEETLFLNQARFESEETLLAFEGVVGTQDLAGQLVAENVSVAFIEGVAQNFIDIPADLEGDLNLVADLSGRIQNPEVQATVAIANPQINDEPLETIEVVAEYDDAILTFDGAIAADATRQATFDGIVPYAFPFMTIQPNRDELAVEAVVQDEGIALVNLFTEGQVEWQEGSGLVVVQVTGPLEDPRIQGTAQLQDGVVSTEILEDPITNITGTAAFDLSRIQVEALSAQLNGQEIQASGSIPVLVPITDPEDPLVITFNEVPIDLEVPAGIDLNFNASVDGQVIITGAVLTPIISGDLGLRDGEVDVFRGFAAGLFPFGATTPAVREELVEEEIEEESDLDLAEIEAELERRGFPVSIARILEAPITGTGDPENFLDQVRLDDLRIALSDDLEIQGNPLFNLSASGDLIVNGTLADPRPDGTIELVSGWINLYTTQFLLDRDAPNTATFNPEGGVNPYLDVTLVARVREVDVVAVGPSPLVTDPLSIFDSPEVVDQSAIPTFGSVQTILVTARVEGTAQELADFSAGNTAGNTISEDLEVADQGGVLELSSDPPRSDRQIVALIGGGLLDTITGGDTAIAAASFIGSGTLANIGSDIADRLGLDFFRIFPTTDLDGESGAPIAIGVEAGINITRDLSFTVLEVLGSTGSPEFGLRYQLTDRILLRSVSDLSGDYRGVLEYRIQF